MTSNTKFYFSLQMMQIHYKMTYVFTSLGENPMEVIDQGAGTTSQARDSVVAESGGPYSAHSPPLVQKPSRGDRDSDVSNSCKHRIRHRSG